MAKKRKKVASRARVCVDAEVMRKLISLGAAHHANLERLRRTVRPVKATKKAKKKTAKGRKKARARK